MSLKTPPSPWVILFGTAAALLILCFSAPFALGHTSRAVFSTLFWLTAAAYPPLFVSYVFLPEPVNGRPWLHLAFWPVMALMVGCLLSDILLAGSGLLMGKFLLQVGPICHVLLLSISSLMHQSPRFFRSPALWAGVLLASNPIWALPLLNAAHKFDGTAYMGQWIYWFFFLPLGVFTVAADIARWQRWNRLMRHAGSY